MALASDLFPGPLQDDNAKLRHLGIDFDTDWRSIVREVIRWLECTGVASAAAASVDGA